MLIYGRFSKIFKSNNKKTELSLSVTNLNDAEKQKISNFRMRSGMEGRMEMSKYLGYFMFLGTIYYLQKRPDFEMLSLAGSEMYERAVQMIVRKFPGEKTLLFNETSLGGRFRYEADFKVQFSGKEVSGTGWFQLRKTSLVKWDWEKAELVYKIGKQNEIHKKILVSRESLIVDADSKNEGEHNRNKSE